MSQTFTIITGRSREEEVDNSFYNYSDFQIQFMKLVSHRPRFEFFVTHGHFNVGQPRKAGPSSILWYEAGKLHAQRVGMARTLCDEIISDS